MKFSKEILRIDPEGESDRIASFIREKTVKRFKRRGVVVGLSGGVDSAVVAELCVRALPKGRVLALLLPEKESDPMSLDYAQKQARKMGIEAIVIDITSHLDSLGVYDQRNATIRKIFPQFDSAWKFNVTVPQDLLESDRYNYRLLTIDNGDGNPLTKRIPASDWFEISAFQNMKQRSRMLQLYHHAEKRNYLVVGTANKLEKSLGYYVKYGDGGVDIDPISHLYKTQVYELAHHLSVIPEIISRPSSPDTYSLPVTHKAFYFRLDYLLLDLLLCGYEAQVQPEVISVALGLTLNQSRKALEDIQSKHRATLHLHQTPENLS